MLSEGKTYREVGKYFNLSEERVRQLYNEMIERLP
ncbi:sigma factor-like helix-turn-helix DNA-binding protein [Mammaliicoccus sciuri]